MSGMEGGNPMKKCKECGGAGQFDHCADPECSRPGEPCAACNGLGYVCGNCAGAFTRGERGDLCADCVAARAAQPAAVLR
jgi:hypothetical protein